MISPSSSKVCINTLAKSPRGMAENAATQQPHVAAQTTEACRDYPHMSQALDSAKSPTSISVTGHTDTPVYCAWSPGRRRLILGIITVTGALGPLSGAMFLPVLPLLEREFNVGSTSINATVSVFMATFAVTVSLFVRGDKHESLTCFSSLCFGPALQTSRADGRCTLFPWRYSSWQIFFWLCCPRTMEVWSFCAFFKHLARGHSWPWAPAQLWM